MSDDMFKHPELHPWWEGYIQETKALHRHVEEHLKSRITALEAERDALAAQLAEAVEALEYVMDGYGLDPTKYEQPFEDEDDWIVSRVRATLAKLEAKP